MRLILFLAFLIPTSAFGVSPDLSADSVEVFRVAPSWEKREATGKMFHQYQVLAGPRRTSEPAGLAISRELQRIYSVDWMSRYCAFTPRYGIRLHRRRGVVDVLICPHCGEVHFVMGKTLRVASVSGEILRQLKSFFPDFPLRDDEA